MTPYQATYKRTFDIGMAIVGLFICLPIICVAFFIASYETRSLGIYSQTRLGRKAAPFRIYKIKTMYETNEPGTTVTISGDSRITRSGAIFRRFKVDELPQLVNVLLGQMSFVGPRPDVPGYLDGIEEKYQLILQLRPGITGPASLKYRNEEAILAKVNDPLKYNDEIIWPDKLQINLNYYNDWSFRTDIIYLWKTLADQ